MAAPVTAASPASKTHDDQQFSAVHRSMYGGRAESRFARDRRTKLELQRSYSEEKEKRR